MAHLSSATVLLGEVAGKIVQHPVRLPTPLVQIWCGTSPARLQQSVSSQSATLTHPGILSSFDSQRLTEDSATAMLWKNASSPFPAFTDVLIELLSLSLLIAGIITGTLEWAVQAGHLLSGVTLESHGSEIRGARTGKYRSGNSPSGRPHWCGSFEILNGHQPQNWKSVARTLEPRDISNPESQPRPKC